MTAEEVSSDKTFSITPENQHYINIMRGISILRVVLVHLGLSWFYPPYSQYIGIFLPVLFFVSGAVSYYSFIKSSSLTEFLIKRLVLILTPFYIFAAIVIFLDASIYDGGFPEMDQLLRWLFVWPDLREVFFPLGQIWFINALVVMIFLTLPIFILSRKYPVVLLIGVVAPFLLSLANFFLPIYENFMAMSWLRNIIWPHQPWQTLILSCVFCAGAAHYRFFQHLTVQTLASIATTLLVVSLLAFWALELDLELKEHVRKRSIYYLLLSFFAIYFLLAIRPLMLWVLSKFRPLEWLFLYANKYAYSIFLLHTLVLFSVEKVFNMEDLSGQVFMALLRMLMVVVITLILAKPLGEASKALATRIRNGLLTKLK
jgi:peptidoglycan/LPS O-acetylase OafA/YrhL